MRKERAREKVKKCEVCGFRDQETEALHTLTVQSCLHLCLADDLWQSVLVLRYVNKGLGTSKSIKFGLLMHNSTLLRRAECLEVF